jgi:hypothetical protein
MPGLLSQLNHLEDRSFRPALDTFAGPVVMDASDFSSSSVRLRSASSSASQSSMFTGARSAPASQEQPSHEAEACVLHGMIKCLLVSSTTSLVQKYEYDAEYVPMGTGKP